MGGNLESIRAALLIGFIFRFVLKRVKRERKPVRRTDSKLWRKQQTGENSDTKYVICHKRIFLSLSIIFPGIQSF